MLRWLFMQLSDVFLRLGEDTFKELIRGISIGRLKTYQLYDGLKVSAHVSKLNTETLRKSVPRLWSRLSEHDEPLAKELGQAVLVSHLDMITAVLNYLGIPNESGFFAKDIDPKSYLAEGWQAKVLEHFRGAHPEPLLLFYVNHLAWELAGAEEPFVPSPSPVPRQEMRE
jgi:hypothetical protein